MSIRVALVEDNERFLSRLIERLAYFDDIEVLYGVGSAEALFDRLGAEPRPDVLLVDIGLPGASGIEVVSRLAGQEPEIGALMLTVFEEPDKILAAIQAGAAGYLLKDAPAERIAAAIREVHEGGAPLSRPVARHVLRLLGRVPAGRTGDSGGLPVEGATGGASHDESPLSTREIELLEQIVAGGTEAEIADRLCISPHTVRTHVKNIYRKLRVNSRAAAVRVAYERGLTSPRNTRNRR